MIKRPANIEAMKNVFTRVWSLSHSLIRREVGENLYIFQFEDAKEKDRAFLRQPWSFNKSLIVFKEFDGLSVLESINMNRSPFWIQVHGLPLGIMNTRKWVR